MSTDRADPATTRSWTPRDRDGELVSQYHRLGIGAVAAAALAIRKPGTPLTARPPIADATRP